MSDKDREFLQSITPSIANTREGRATMIESRRRLAQRQAEIARFAREFRRGRRTFDDAEFFDALDKRFGNQSGSSLFADLQPPQQTRTIGNRNFIQRGGEWFEVTGP